MFQRALSPLPSSGGSKIPFTLFPFNDRVTINSQNCYIYDDNGTVKIHYEYSMTANTTMTNGTILYGLVLAKLRTKFTNFPSNSNWSISYDSNVLQTVYGNISNGTVYTMNEDVICDWND